MPTESDYPPIDIPDVDTWTFLFERTDKPYPDDKVIYLDPDTKRNYTYRTVRDTATGFGKGLKSTWNWQKGDVLALYTPNSIDTPAVIWGCQWAGGIISPANPTYTADELAFQLKDAGAKALVTQKPFLDIARKAAAKVGLREDRIILLGDLRDPTGRFKHFSTMVDNSSRTQGLQRTILSGDGDLAFLVYSSGTTGLPKGVMLSHTNIIANVLQMGVTEAANLTWYGGPNGEGDSTLGFLPFFHIYGLACLIHQALYVGLRLVVMAKFDLEKFCALIQEYKITFAYVVPPVLLGLGKHPIVSKYDLSSVRMLSSGAAPLTRDLVDAVYSRLKIPIKQGYGLSETSPASHTQPWRLWRTTIGSVGRLVPNMTAKYMSADEAELPPGQTGELWLKGPNVFKGYLNNPAGTAHALTADGYFKTGDVGHQDEHGNFWITDRVKELIKYKGFQVAPAELEGLLVGHPKIADAAVIGVDDSERATEVPRAYIVPTNGVPRNEKTEREIMDWLAGRVAVHKQLRGGVRWVDEVPKSVSGKILRRVLKDGAKKEIADAERRKSGARL
ncbi:MAG: hypothetical protein M1813_008069 [Trichoglossum hirsutum]|nr:MAG: hypothetical protein M1813_008069 [Trichoglossum hirsutum]